MVLRDLVISESCCRGVGASRVRERDEEGLEGRSGMQRHTWDGVVERWGRMRKCMRLMKPRLKMK